MEKLAILKKMIADISNNEYYKGVVFYGDNDDYFAFCEGKIYVTEREDLSYFFSIHFTPEEKQEVARIEKELKLNGLTFLPIRGHVAYDLQSLIEYYTGEDYDEEDEDYDEEDEDCNDDKDAEIREDPDVKNKIEEIKKLQAVFKDKTSIFYHRESQFLELYLYPEIKISGAPYVRSSWDHDDAYYYGLNFSTGVCDLLYDIVVGYDSLVYPDLIEDDSDSTDEEKEKEYDRWIEILSEIDGRIVG